MKAAQLVAIVALVWPLVSAGQAGQRLSDSPRVVVIFQPPASSATRQHLESALRDSGAIVVAPGASTADVRRLARNLGVDGVVEIGIRGNRAAAQVRVLDADGNVRLTDELRLPGHRLSRKEARSLATLVVGAITAPRIAQPEPAPPPPPVPPEKEIEASKPPSEATTPTPPQVPQSFVPAPRDDTRRALDFWAAGTGTWRSSQAGATTSANSLRFGTNAPYAGLAIGFETEPFLRPSLRWLGFDVSYSFSYARVSSPNLPAGVTGENATEHRFLLDALGQTLIPKVGGMASLRVGMAYEGFIVPFDPPLVSATHFSPRVVLDYQRPVIRSIAVDGGVGIRPFAIVGSDLTNLYGPTSSSIGLEAHGGISGSLDRFVSRLRWTLAYEFLRYSDHFVSTGGQGTSFVENYNRLELGLIYLP